MKSSYVIFFFFFNEATVIGRCTIRDAILFFSISEMGFLEGNEIEWLHKFGQRILDVLQGNRSVLEYH